MTTPRTEQEQARYRALWVIHDNMAAGCVIPAMYAGGVNMTPANVMMELKRKKLIRTSHEGRLAWLTSKGTAEMWRLDQRKTAA